MLSVKVILIVVISSEHIDMNISLLKGFGNVSECLDIIFLLLKPNSNIPTNYNPTILKIISIDSYINRLELTMQISCKVNVIRIYFVCVFGLFDL